MIGFGRFRNVFDNTVVHVSSTQLFFATTIFGIAVLASGGRSSLETKENEMGLKEKSEGCNFAAMKPGEHCVAKWKHVHPVLHPSQEAAGYAAVNRKLQKGFRSNKDAQKAMGSCTLPFILGKNKVPFLIDSHHTTSALQASGFDDVRVRLHMICDWSHLDDKAFYQNMVKYNFMHTLGRPRSEPGSHNDLPVVVPPEQFIPNTVAELVDDPWRSLAALVRKLEHKTFCKQHGLDKKCFRAYVRECDMAGHMIPFFEFRWAFFMNHAFNVGCESEDCLWDSKSDCKRFEHAYNALPHPRGIKEEDLDAWMVAADLLRPLCRGKKALEYRLPESLQAPMGGKPLPGLVLGNDPIKRDDPTCTAAVCPKLDLCAEL
jgi:hypothetical protein